MLEPCYTILGLEKGATIDEIKKAYRHFARQYHPDVCNDPDAKDKFIQVNEAYELLIKHTQNINKGIFTPENDFYTNDSVNSAYIEWLKYVQNKARARAARNAKLKFEQFKESYIYKSAKAASWIFDIIYLICGVFIVVAPYFFASFEHITSTRKVMTIVVTVGAEIFGLLFIYFIIKSRVEIIKGSKNYGI
jgi:hypothetical protein